jgi:putative hydrolase of the HAD superfamily
VTPPSPAAGGLAAALLDSGGVLTQPIGGGLPDLHAGLGMGEFFEAYAMSGVLGCRKPDPRMYHHASEALGLVPAQCLFVDDDPELVAAAIALGYGGRAMCRDGTPPSDGTPFISSLDQLLELF